ncbi:hypothetical protein U91I_01893 [alpha proteobacterium U9-1i]|nr:hypothetical protein U91I_01893 [alpha proteobacterium U9-1i]
MENGRHRGLLAAALLGSAAAFLGPAPLAMAQDAEEQAANTDDIVVTAQRREQSIQDVPISIAAMSAERIEDSGLTNFANLEQSISGLTTVANGDARAARIGIRGVTTAQENGKQSSVGVYVDGVFMSRVGMSFADLPDVERIEVLRGPQGTLFGMNTAAGLIHMITARPDLDEFGGHVETVIGNYDRIEARGSITGPIVPGRLGFSLGATSTNRGGIIYNSTLGRDVDDLDRWGIRGKLLYDGDDVSALFIADYQEEDSNCCVKVLSHLRPPATFSGFGSVTALAPPGFPFARVAVTNVPNYNRPEGGGLSAEVTWDLDGGYTLTSLSAWRTWSIFHQDDPDGLPIDGITGFRIWQDHDQISQEVRLASPVDGMFSWQVGLFYFDRNSTSDDYITYPSTLRGLGQDGTNINNFEIEAQTLAAFGHVTWNLTDRLSATGGVRYTNETQDAHAVQVSNNLANPSFNRTASLDEGATTWNVSAEYDISDDIMIYAAAGHGFKPGGFDMNRTAAFTTFTFEEETNTNIEAGVRSVLFDNRLLLNATVFNTNFENFQTLAFDGLRFFNTNAPEFETRGLEIETTLHPTDNLTLRGSATFINTEYISFPNGPCPQGVAGSCNLTGRKLYQAPDTTWAVSAQYEHELTEAWNWFALGEYNYRSGAYSGASLDPYLHQNGFGLANFRLGVESDEGLRLEAWVRNAFNEDYMNFEFNSPLLTGGYAGFVGEPQMYGVRIRKEF